MNDQTSPLPYGTPIGSLPRRRDDDAWSDPGPVPDDGQPRQTGEPFEYVPVPEPSSWPGVGSGGSDGSVGYPTSTDSDGSTVLTVQSVTRDRVAALAPGEVLDLLVEHFARYVRPLHVEDLAVLALWTAHTHLGVECYTTPRLMLDSPLPESGKTTTLEHLARLAHAPVQMGSVSTPAMLARLLDAGGEGSRTLLIDEVDRNLSPDRDGVGDLLAILNSGYKRGATRPTTVPVKGGGWEVAELPTFAPVALAGNSPRLPLDTASRTIRVLLVPDRDGVVSPSDWEDIEDDARDLAELLAAWADSVRATFHDDRPEVPAGLSGRNRERWYPLLRVAHAAGGDWPALTLDLITRDLEMLRQEREDDVTTYPPAIRVLQDIANVWPPGEAFVTTKRLCAMLAGNYPDEWGATSPFGKDITPQRLGRMLGRGHRVFSERRDQERGYYLQTLVSTLRRFGITPPGETD